MDRNVTGKSLKRWWFSKCREVERCFVISAFYVQLKCIVRSGLCFYSLSMWWKHELQTCQHKLWEPSLILLYKIISSFLLLPLTKFTQRNFRFLSHVTEEYGVGGKSLLRQSTPSIFHPNGNCHFHIIFHESELFSSSHRI